MEGGVHTTPVTREILLDFKETIWDSKAAPMPHHVVQSRFIRCPFAFHFPNHQLPPSYHSVAVSMSAAVRYFIRVTGRLKGWKLAGIRHPHIRVVQAFPFVPFDDFPPPAPLEYMPVARHATEIPVRKGIMGGYGNVEAEVRVPTSPIPSTQDGFQVFLPAVQSFPLFTDIPITIHIKCFSKEMPHSHSMNSSHYTFPLPPSTPTAVELDLIRTCHYDISEHSSNLGSVGGFGKMHAATKGVQSHMHTDIGPPCWIQHPGVKHEGRWWQEVTFKSNIVFRCSPSFGIPRIRTTVRTPALLLLLY